MKLRQLLQLVKDQDLESDLDQLNIDFIIIVQERELSRNEWEKIYDQGNDDGYMKGKDLNPYTENSRKWEAYNSGNRSGIRSAGR
jgi:hypothetical protein